MGNRLPTDKTLWGLTLLMGLALWLAWPPLPFFPLLFVGFIPLLLLEERIRRTYRSKSTLILFEHAYLGFVLWNALTTWWVALATLAGAIVAILANSFLMCLPVLAFHAVRRKLGATAGYIGFIAFWLTFEFLHHQWELTWPWLTLGNGLAKFPAVIQWYEYTGVLGGSLWILIVTVLLFQALRAGEAVRHNQQRFSLNWRRLLAAGIVIAIPIGSSLLRYWNFKIEGEKREIVIVQPNIDPYREKFDGMSPRAQLKHLIEMSRSTITPSTDYLVWPETALQFTMWVEKLDSHAVVKGLRTFLRSYPNTTLITGIYAYQNYPQGNGASATARYYNDGTCCYDAYNSAVQIDTGGVSGLYHKSKLVPGVERMPYPQLFGFLDKLAIDLGGISGSLGTQKERAVFTSRKGDKIAPVICYESVFGEYVTRYIHKGAQAIFIITNDGWWGNTPGHKQHLHYASLRAIETRRSIARAANTGVSCFINRRGDILQPTRYDEQAVIRSRIAFSSATTFYSRAGDYIGRGALLLTLFLALAMFLHRMTAGKNT